MRGLRSLLAIACVAALCWGIPQGVFAQEDSHAAEGDHAHAEGDAHAAGEHADDHAAGAHGEGDHHEEYTIWGDLPFWSLIAFLGFVFAIKKLGLWDLMTSSMATREQAEADAIRIAEEELTAADERLRQARGRMEALDETIRETLAEAERDATSTRGDILGIAEREARQAVARAEHEIDRVKSQSLNELFSSLADKVATVTEERLRQQLQSDDQSRLINQTLEQLSAR